MFFFLRPRDSRDVCVNPVVKSGRRLHVGADFFLRPRDSRDVCVNPVVKSGRRLLDGGFFFYGLEIAGLSVFTLL